MRVMTLLARVQTKERLESVVSYGQFRIYEHAVKVHNLSAKTSSVSLNESLYFYQGFTLGIALLVNAALHNSLKQRTARTSEWAITSTELLSHQTSWMISHVPWMSEKQIINEPTYMLLHLWTNYWTPHPLNGQKHRMNELTNLLNEPLYQLNEPPHSQN